MSRFLDFLFSATGALVVLFISAVWIAARPRSTAARLFVVSVGIFYLLASMYAVPAAVSRLLTIGYQRLERIDESPHKAALVLLGAGDEVGFGWDDRISVPNAVAGARVLEAWRVYRLVKPHWGLNCCRNLGPDTPVGSSST